MGSMVDCPHCSRKIIILGVVVGSTTKCVYCDGVVIVRSPHHVDPLSPDAIDLKTEINKTLPHGVDGSDMLARTSDPFSDDADINLIVDAIEPEPEPEPDADLKSINSLDSARVDDIISEVNRILGEEE